MQRDVSALPAVLLDPRDDVATALDDLPAATTIVVGSGPHAQRIVTREAIPAGHKLAVRALSAGRRIRKYGEFIGRVTVDVPPGAWIHVHNLATNARRSGSDEQAWRAQSAPEGAIHAVGARYSAGGAAPRFDARSNRLYWLDSRESMLHAVDPADSERQTWPLDAQPQGFVLVGDGGLMLATTTGFLHFDPASGTTRRQTAVRPPPSQRWTAVQCDPQGRVWCACADPSAGTASGALQVVEPDGTVTPMITGLAAPSALVWNGAGTTLCFTEAGRALIHACDYEPAKGTLGKRRVIADLGAMPGELGGATMDCEDHLWLCLNDAGSLMRVAPDGSVVRVLRLPVDCPTACAFGGADYRSLFVTTARAGTPSPPADDNLAGQVLVVDVGVAGFPTASAAAAYFPDGDQ